METRFFAQFKTIGVGTLFCLCVSAPSMVLAENGCRGGASPLANAFVRANPMYAYFFGDIEKQKRGQFSHCNI